MISLARAIGVKTKTSSWEGYKVAVFCTLAVSFRGEIKLNRLQIIAFQIYRNIGVEDDICGKLLFSREFANRRIHAWDQSDCQQCFASQLGERED